MLQSYLSVILLCSLLPGKGFSQQCYSQPNCVAGSEIATPADSPTSKDCCVRTNEGQSYADSGGNCVVPQCIVHGFANTSHDVVEGERLDTMFELNVKGTTSLPLVILGTITSEAGTAGPSDFESLQPLSVEDNSAKIRLFTINDAITLEYEDSVILRFNPASPLLIPGVEGVGEFIRDTATVNIIDNDRLQINFERDDYSIQEDASSNPAIRLQFRRTQSPFTMTIFPVSIENLTEWFNFTAENFITIPMITEAIATPGDDFTSAPFTITIPATEDRPPGPIFEDIQQSDPVPRFMVIDDDVNELEQSFALVAVLGDDVPDSFTCFQRQVGLCLCFGRTGATEIRIKDTFGPGIKFEQDDYSTLEGARYPVIRLQLPRMSRSFRMTIFTVSFINLNFTSKAFVNIPTKHEALAASGDDFTSAPFTITIPATEDRPPGPIFEDIQQDDPVPRFRVIDDDVNEIEQSFALVAVLGDDVPDNITCLQRQVGDPDCFGATIIKIVDNDAMIIGFSQRRQTVSESAASSGELNNIFGVHSLRESEMEYEIQFRISETGIALSRQFQSYFDTLFGNRDSEEEPIEYSLILDIGSLNLANRLETQVINDSALGAQECYEMKILIPDVCDRELFTCNEDEVAPTDFFCLRTLCIEDDDVAVVGLEKTFYRTTEGLGVVEVCAVVYSPSITCPIEFPFSILLQTADGSAVSSMDYGAVSRLLRFASCETRQCTEITIMNDTILEDIESFFVSLVRISGLDTRITLNPVNGEIEIAVRITCSAIGMLEVEISCEPTPVSLQCSFDGGPLHQCNLPLVITSGVSPAGNHSVRILTNIGLEDTVSYIISDTAEPTGVSVQVPSLGVYMINKSPQVTNDSVEAEFLITRPVAGVRCFLRSQIDRIWQNCSSGQISFSNLKPGLYVLKVQAFNKKLDVNTVKRGFEINSDPNYCSIVLVNRGVIVNEDDTSAEIDIQLYGPATQLSCMLDRGEAFTCKSPVQLSGLTAGRHTLEITPLGCSGGSRTLSVQFTT